MPNNPKSLIPAAGIIVWALLTEQLGLAGTNEAKALAFVVTFLTTVIFIKACKRSTRKASVINP